MSIQLRYSFLQASLLQASLLAFATLAPAQEAPLAWDQVKNFQYNLPPPAYDPATRTLTILFSVTNPSAGNAPYELLGTQVAIPFKPPATLRIDVSWNSGSWGTTELLNTKDVLTPVLRTVSAGIVSGTAPASAVAINALAATTKRCSDAGSPCPLVSNASLTYWVRYTLPAAAAGAGRVALEGHPSIQTGVDPITQTPIYTSVPVKSVFRDFLITPGATARRAIVDFNKCATCHDGRLHGKTVVPRLSLHGANRNEEPGVCVMCHNPNQTDAAYRTSGSEESIDFKRMVHGIHAGGFRKTPLIIIGRNGSVNNYSSVRFPSELRNCVKCHIDNGARGTFELPMSTTLGSTINSLSVLTPAPGQVDVDPSNDLRISPIAATCSGCHDKSETRQHMVRMGASFGVVQSALAGREQCVTCHGPGKSRDVRRAHEISQRSGSGDR